MSKLTSEEKEKLIESIRRGDVDDDQLERLKSKKEKTSNVALCEAIKKGNTVDINDNLLQVNLKDQFGKCAISYAKTTSDIILLLKADAEINEDAKESIIGFTYDADELITIINYFINHDIDLLDDFGEDKDVFLNVLLETIDHDEDYYDDFLPRLAVLLDKHNMDMEYTDYNLEHVCIALSTIRWMKKQANK